LPSPPCKMPLGSKAPPCPRRPAAIRAVYSRPPTAQLQIVCLINSATLLICQREVVPGRRPLVILMSDRHAVPLSVTVHLPGLHGPRIWNSLPERCLVCHVFSNISSKTESILISTIIPVRYFITVLCNSPYIVTLRFFFA